MIVKENARRIRLENVRYGDCHVHTNYTDGKNSIKEYCQKALENDIKVITFTEHVRKNMNYDFDSYLLDIEKARKAFPHLVILGGCEVKVSNTEGELDAPENILRQCEIVTGVFHSFEYRGKQSYLAALKAMLRNPIVHIWGHPTLFLRKHNIRLDEEELNEIIRACVESGGLIERNLKYDVPDANFIKLASNKGAKFVIGSDAHSVDELPTIHRLREEWNWINKMC